MPSNSIPLGWGNGPGNNAFLPSAALPCVSMPATFEDISLRSLDRVDFSKFQSKIGGHMLNDSENGHSTNRTNLPDWSPTRQFLQPKGRREELSAPAARTTVWEQAWKLPPKWEAGAPSEPVPEERI